LEFDAPGIHGAVHLDGIVMLATEKQKSAKPKRKGDVPSRLSGLFFLWGGISVLLVLAVLVAVRSDPGLGDFLFWPTTIWIVLVRYIETSSSDGEFLQLSRTALRKWLHFSAILVIAAGSLYPLARIAASLSRS
jgi:hypothetical protein